MGKRILILDDDADFNNLLTDIFSQADYDVTSEHDPEIAVKLLGQTDFDLVVTDQKMPGLSGEEFIREVKSSKPELPVIMVSGYLDNDTIRRLIQDGVGGVFLKPLNVFSLLKRTAALIEARESGRQRKSGEDAEGGQDSDSEQFKHSLPFKFNSLPCKAVGSSEFAKKLYSLRNFKTNLIIISPQGSDLRAYISDLSGFSAPGEDVFIFADLKNASTDSLKEQIGEGLRTGANRLTVVLENAERMTSDQKKIIFALSSKEAPFDEFPSPIRLLFHVSEDLDEIYDRGEIDDDLYMFMGTSEVKAPALNDIREDVPILAQSMIKEACGAQGIPVPTLEPPARVFLRDYDWVMNTTELRRFVKAIVERGQSLYSREDFEDIASQLRNSSQGKGVDLRRELEGFRADLCHASLLLCQGNQEVASAVIGLPADFVLEAANRLCPLNK